MVFKIIAREFVEPADVTGLITVGLSKHKCSSVSWKALGRQEAQTWVVGLSHKHRLSKAEWNEEFSETMFLGSWMPPRRVRMVTMSSKPNSVRNAINPAENHLWKKNNKKSEGILDTELPYFGPGVCPSWWIGWWYDTQQHRKYQIGLLPLAEHHRSHWDWMPDWSCNDRCHVPVPKRKCMKKNHPDTMHGHTAAREGPEMSPDSSIVLYSIFRSTSNTGHEGCFRRDWYRVVTVRTKKCWGW